MVYTGSRVTPHPWSTAEESAPQREFQVVMLEIPYQRLSSPGQGSSSKPVPQGPGEEVNSLPDLLVYVTEYFGVG